MLYIVGLGSGAADSVTPLALEKLKNCPQVLLRTSALSLEGWLENLGIKYESLDGLYESAEDFDSLNARIADRVLEAALKGDTAYAVSDVAEASVGALLARIRAGKPAVKFEIVAGVSMCGTATAGLSGEFQIMDASNWQSAHINPRIPLVIRELDTRLLASELKVRLLDSYPSDAGVMFFAGGRGYPIKLEQLDRQARYDHRVSVRVEPITLDVLSEKVMSSDGEVHFDFEHLIEIVHKLRAPDGCPWDREQTHRSLRKSLIEECYEALDCIDHEDWNHLYDELGDVLLQVALHSQIADEYGEFNIEDVTSAICRKLIFRHSHIFGSDKAENSREVLKIWEERKKREKGLKTAADAMADVCPALPELMRADKVQSKAAKVGFDWHSPEAALEKVYEEAGEVKQALAQNSNVEEELGDLLFICANVARLSGYDSEQALRAATNKFIDRFTRMEKAIAADGHQLSELTQPQMDMYWEKIKRQ